MTEKYIVAGHTWNDPWEGKDMVCEYQFRRPGKDEISRFTKEVGKSAASAQNNLMISIVHPEDLERLKKDLETHPGLLMSLAAWALKASGFSDLGN